MALISSGERSAAPQSPGVMLARWACQPCSRTSRISVPAQRNSASSGWARTLRTTFAMRAVSGRPGRLPGWARGRGGNPSGWSRARELLDKLPPSQYLLLDLIEDQGLALEVPIEGALENRLGQELVAAVESQQGPVGRQGRWRCGLAEECLQGQVAGQVGSVDEAIGTQVLPPGVEAILLDDGHLAEVLVLLHDLAPGLQRRAVLEGLDRL